MFNRGNPLAHNIMPEKIPLLKDVDDFMRDCKVQLVGAEGMVSKPIMFERINDMRERLELVIILAERERRMKL